MVIQYRQIAYFISMSCQNFEKNMKSLNSFEMNIRNHFTTSLNFIRNRWINWNI